MHLSEKERRELALEIIGNFRDGTGISWSDVETVFDVVKPLLNEKIEETTP